MVEQVRKWLLAGASEADIAEAVEANWPGQKPGPLLAAVMKRFSDTSQFDPAVVTGWAFEATRDVYRRAIEVGDLAVALRAAKQVNEITRDYVPNEEDDEAQQQAPRQVEAGEGPVRQQEAAGSGTECAGQPGTP
jgi:hypothetical protein